MTTKAFYGKPELKDKLVSEIKIHMGMDNYRQGRYWGRGKGCAIGCLAKDVLNRHEFLFKKYGIPKFIFLLVDDIFESLSVEESKKWSLRIFDAIKVGQDLSQVWPKFGNWLFVDEVHGVINLVEKTEEKSNIKIIADSILNETEDSDIAKKAVQKLQVSPVSPVLRVSRVSREAREAQKAWALWAARATWEKTRPTQETAKIQSDKLVEIINS